MGGAGGGMTGWNCWMLPFEIGLGGALGGAGEALLWAARMDACRLCTIAGRELGPAIGCGATGILEARVIEARAPDEADASLEGPGTGSGRAGCTKTFVVLALERFGSSNADANLRAGAFPAARLEFSNPSGVCINFRFFGEGPSYEDLPDASAHIPTG